MFIKEYFLGGWKCKNVSGEYVLKRVGVITTWRFCGDHLVHRNCLG